MPSQDPRASTPSKPGFPRGLHLAMPSPCKFKSPHRAGGNSTATRCQRPLNRSVNKGRPAAYGIGTEIELEVPTSLVAVMVNDCTWWTRSVVVLPFDRTNGIATRNAPPNVCEVVL